MIDLAQLRARGAFAHIDPSSLERPEELLSLARGLPAMLQTNGLLATWSHLLARGKEEHCTVLDALVAHLGAVGRVEGSPGPRELLEKEWLATGGGEPVSGVELRRLTAELTEYAVWLKRAAEAKLPGVTAAARAEGAEEVS